MLQRELGREERERLGGDVREGAPRNVAATVLEREGLAEVVLAQGAALQEKCPDPAAGEVLDLQRAGELRLRDQSGLGQEVSDASLHRVKARVPSWWRT